MNNLRTYGKAPFRVAVLHGGPGAAGAAAPMARELSTLTGILEPLQTRDTIDGQVIELRDILCHHADLPSIVIGHSWGAWLGWLLAAEYPDLVKKLVLVSAGPFEAAYAKAIGPERLTRLSEAERCEALGLIEKINNPALRDTSSPMARLGELFSRVDDYDAVPVADGGLGFDQHIYDSIWYEAQELRDSGKLLALAREIRCPVAAVHGDYDPHPADGVREPLSRVLPDFTFYLLKKCGHDPWRERSARDEFFKILKKETGE